MDHIDHLMNSVTPPKPKSGRNLTVGIPRALGYYEFGRLWEHFFTLLGCSVVVSQATNRQILDLGVKSCSNETCLPVKVMAGHVRSLDGRADVIFIPRTVSTGPYAIACPKFCSLPDMMRLNLGTRSEIVEITLDFKDGNERTDESLRTISQKLGMDDHRVFSTFYRAVKNHMTAEMETATFDPPTKPSIVVLGHPYMTGDSFLNMNIVSKLRRLGFEPLTYASLPASLRRKNAYPYYTNRQFYAVGLDNLGGAFASTGLPNIKGIIYLTPFACGIDSLVTEMIERRLQAGERGLPYMKITVDEHTGEAGFDTRLEAFADMLKPEVAN